MLPKFWGERRISNNSRHIVKPRLDSLEERKLLTTEIINTPLSVENPGIFSTTGSLDLTRSNREDDYLFTAAEGAVIKITLTTSGEISDIYAELTGGPDFQIARGVIGTNSIEIDHTTGGSNDAPGRDRTNFVVKVVPNFVFIPRDLQYTIKIEVGPSNPKPDLVPTALTWVGDKTGVRLEYEIRDDDTTNSAKIYGFWSTGTTPDSIIEPQNSAIIPGDAAKTQGTHTINFTSFVRPAPPQATHFLAYIDYDKTPAGPRGSVLESNEGNNFIAIQISEVSDNARIQIMNLPSNYTFYISPDGIMPFVHAKVTGITPGPGETVEYTWRTSVTYRASDYPAKPGQYGPGRDITSPKYDQVIVTNSQEFTPSFLVDNKQVLRGGTLVLTVEATIGGKPIKFSTPAQGVDRIQILGQNPDKATVSKFVEDNLVPPMRWPTDTQYNYHAIIRKIINHESQIRQFHDSGIPLWSRDGNRGAGIMQITDPKPSDDEIWDWRKAILGGERIFGQKFGVSIRKLDNIRKEITAEAARAGATVAPITGDMLVLDAIRGYNGYYNGLGNMAEWREVRDDQGKLVIGSDKKTIWERRPALERIRVELRTLPHQEILMKSPGNYRYVDDILETPDF